MLMLPRVNCIKQVVNSVLNAVLKTGSPSSEMLQCKT